MIVLWAGKEKKKVESTGGQCVKMLRIYVRNHYFIGGITFKFFLNML